jgi:hypothetical protein
MKGGPASRVERTVPALRLTCGGEYRYTASFSSWVLHSGSSGTVRLVTGTSEAHFLFGNVVTFRSLLYTDGKEASKIASLSVCLSVYLR